MNKLTKGIVLTILILGVAIIGYSSVNYNKTNQVEHAIYNTNASGSACTYMNNFSDCSQKSEASMQVATYTENNYNCVTVKKTAAALVADGQSKFSCSATSKANCSSSQTMTAAKTGDCDMACQEECPMGDANQVAVNQ